MTKEHKDYFLKVAKETKNFISVFKIYFRYDSTSIIFAGFNNEYGVADCKAILSFRGNDDFKDMDEGHEYSLEELMK